MILSELARIVWRRRWVTLLVIVAVVAGAVYFVSRQPDRYDSTGTIGLFPSTDESDPIFFPALVESLVPTYVQIVESREFRDTVAADLDFASDGSDLGGSVRARPGTGNILKVTATADTPARAQQIADATSKALVDRIEETTSQIRPDLIDPPLENDDRVSPRPTLVIGAASILAVILGVAAAFGWERLFGRIYTSRELAEASDVPVVGVMPEESGLRHSRHIVIGGGLTRVEEGFRSIATNVIFASADRLRGALMISALNAGDGKSTVAANLAVAMGELGSSVLLVDGDLRKPVQHEIFGTPNNAGLTSTVLANADPASLVQRTEYQGVYVVPAGPSLHARSEELRIYLEELPKFTKMADIVLVDSPPLRAADDVRLMAASAGGVLLLVRAGTAGASEVRRAVDSLTVLGANVMGTVLTRARAAIDLESTGAYYGSARQGDDRPAGGASA